LSKKNAKYLKDLRYSSKPKNKRNNNKISNDFDSNKFVSYIVFQID